MLQVDLRAAADGPIETNAEVPPTDPALADLPIAPVRPVVVTGRLMASGPGSYYWEGRVRTEVRVDCRRCLTSFMAEVADEVRLLFTEDDECDDPAAVAIPPRATELELAEVIREALILAVPEFPLCREDCRGLCPRCGADLNDGPCGCRSQTDPRWALLRAHPTRPTDDETR